jgi:inhibitor of KinA sporulation pathway (predicted exonuclease)
MKFLCLDLEIEQPYTRADTPDSKVSEPKLIQAGIVVFEIAPVEPIILFSETIHVKYDYPISQFIKTLTSIEDEDVNNSTDLPSDVLGRLQHLRQLYDTSRQIVEWGSGDVSFLIEQADCSQELLHSKYGFARSTINAKMLFQVYAMMNDKKRQGGLSTSMAKLGLQFQGTSYNGKNKGKHWAEADALNTARVFNRLCNLIRK